MFWRMGTNERNTQRFMYRTNRGMFRTRGDRNQGRGKNPTGCKKKEISVWDQHSLFFTQTWHVSRGNIFFFQLLSPCIHSVVCLTTGQQPLQERVLRRVRSCASPFNFQHPLVSFRSYSSCLRLLPRLPVTVILAINFNVMNMFSFAIYM